MQQAFKSAAHWHVNHLPVSYSNRHVIRHILEQVKSFKALPKAQRNFIKLRWSSTQRIRT